MDIYEPINQALTRVDALMNAAEAHGILCGMLCGEHKIDKALWIKHVLGETVNGDILADEAGRRLSLLKAYTFEKLDAPECSFTPLLPDDEQSIFVRTQALGGWCEGFLFGMGLSGVKNLKAFPENLQEFIEDKNFDFMGSEVENVAKFNERFGAVSYRYAILTNSKSTLLKNLMKRYRIITNFAP